MNATTQCEMKSSRTDHTRVNSDDIQEMKLSKYQSNCHVSYYIMCVSVVSKLSSEAWNFWARAITIVMHTHNRGCQVNNYVNLSVQRKVKNWAKG